MSLEICYAESLSLFSKHKAFVWATIFIVTTFVILLRRHQNGSWKELPAVLELLFQTKNFCGDIYHQTYPMALPCKWWIYFIQLRNERHTMWNKEWIVLKYYMIIITDSSLTRSSDNQTWWRHQTETFSALLAICAGNSPVPGEFPTQRPVTRSFDVYFDLRLNKRLSKQS